MSNPNFHQSLVGRLFAVDGRSLAACRIALSSVLLIDLVIRAAEVKAFFTETGMLPLDVWQSLRGTQWVWTLHALSCADAWPVILLVVQAFCAMLLLVGLWSRVATIASWVLAVSLHVRNPLITNSGDAFLRMMLFWGMFAPWGRCWSVDAWRKARAGRVTASALFHPPLHWPSGLLMLQVSCVYFVTGWLKLNDLWLSGEAMHRVAALDFCIRPWGRELTQWPLALTLASRATPWFELVVPLLLWSPWWTVRLRTGIVLMFLAFHLAVDCVVHVGMFGLVSQAAWLVFLPAGFWDAIAAWRRAPASEKPADSVSETVEQPLAQTVERLPASEPESHPTRSWLQRTFTVASHAICGAAVVVVVLSNLDDLMSPPPSRLQPSASRSIVGSSELPDTPSNISAKGGIPATGFDADPDAKLGIVRRLIYRVGDLAMLHQEWTMFREPPRQDSWIVAKGDLADGTQIDVLRHGARWSADGSPRTASHLPSQHYRYLFRRLTFPRYEPFAERCAKYLMQTWNRQHPDQIVSQVTLIIFIETFGETGFERETLVRVGQPPLAAPKEFDLDRALQELDAAFDD